MKYLKTTFYALVLIVGSVLVSCSQGKKETSDSHDHDKMETEGAEKEGHEHAATSTEHSEHAESATKKSGTRIWNPQGNARELIQKDFHFITGSIENINPETIKNEAGENVLKLTPDGTPASFVFHQSYGNIGMAAMVNTSEFNGTFKLIHHAQNLNNHEFVAINGSNMKLGRVIEGEEKVFNEDDFGAGDNWIDLRVTAAGTHFKGYVGSKNITHGHGDKMNAGFVGIMMEGEGSVLIKSIEVSALEEE